MSPIQCPDVPDMLSGCFRYAVRMFPVLVSECHRNMQSHMELEDAGLADKFAYTIDRAYERGTDLGLSDEEFRIEISNALDEWLDRNKPDII